LACPASSRRFFVLSSSLLKWFFSSSECIRSFKWAWSRSFDSEQTKYLLQFISQSRCFSISIISTISFHSFKCSWHLRFLLGIKNFQQLILADLTSKYVNYFVNKLWNFLKKFKDRFFICLLYFFLRKSQSTLCVWNKSLIQDWHSKVQKSSYAIFLSKRFLEIQLKPTYVLLLKMLFVICPTGITLFLSIYF
jgi:hypothetical protein